jgi:hypothetical protein
MTQQLVPEMEVKEPPSRANRRLSKKTLLTALVSLLVLLLSCEAVARILVVAFKPPMGPSQFFDSKFQLAQQPPINNRPSLLFIGSSIGAFSIYSDLIHYTLRKQGYDLDVRNICSIFSRTPERLFLLKTAIKSGAKPLLVVCDVDQIEYSTRFQQRSLPEQESHFTTSHLALVYGDQPLSWKSKLKRVLVENCYLYAYRPFLQSFVQRSPSIILHPERRWKASSFMADQWFEQTMNSIDIALSKTGWCPTYGIADEAAMEHSKFTGIWSATTGPASPGWFSIDSQRQLIDYCAEQHIPLAFLVHPMYPFSTAQKAEWEKEHLVTPEQVNQQLKSALSELPNVYFLECQNSDMNRSHFADSVHENPAGAMSFSERLSQALLGSPYSNLLAKGRSK